jgi:large subunit ribosomal protein L25
MVGGFELNAELRTTTGKSEARRARRQGKVLAVLYGGGQDPICLNLEHHKVLKALENEAVYSHILTLKYDGKAEKAILKAIQRHPARPIVMHMDFQRVNESDKLRVHVPLHFINQETSIGVKKGGVVTHAMVEVEIDCLPQHLPEFIEVDLANVDIGGAVHLSDIKLPAGVAIHALLQGTDHDLPVASIHGSRTAEAE